MSRLLTIGCCVGLIFSTVCADADSPKRIFEGLLHTGRPAFDTLYGIQPLRFISRTSYAGWSDGATLPPAAWYDNVAAAYTNANNYLLVDHEDWPNTTQAERLATAAKFVTMYQELKTRLPGFQIGFYSYTTKRDWFRAIQGEEDADYQEWQAENNDMAAVTAVVDFFAPSIYMFYTRAVDGAEVVANAPAYFLANVNEAKRVRTAYGRNQPIFPYVLHQRTDLTADIDVDVYVEMVRTAYLEADGAILWGGWDGAAMPWAENATWWGRFLKDFPFGDRTLLKPRAVRN